MILSMPLHVPSEGGREKRTTSTAVAPGGPAERHLKEIVFLGASPQTPGLAALELEGEQLAEDAKGSGGDTEQHG